MGRIIKLVVVICVVWAAWHAGMAAWQQFRFSNDVDQIAQFGADKPEDVVRAAVLSAAAKSGLPVTEKDVRIRRTAQPPDLYIDVSYTVQVEILPRYRYPWTFNASAHGWFVPGGRAPLR
jgi:hypothetical protein